MIAKKAPNPTDKHVGARVRMRRMMLSMSQEKLGDALGLTFQQVQKYEKGANRIGASRLQQIAHILQVPVAFFFDGAPAAPGQTHDGFSEAPSPSLCLRFPRDLRRPGVDQGFHGHQGRQIAPPDRRSGRADRAAKTSPERTDRHGPPPIRLPTTAHILTARVDTAKTTRDYVWRGP